MSAVDLYAELLSLLDSPSGDPVRQTLPASGGRVWSFCPSHADGTKHGKRSMSLTPIYGLDCFAGCRFVDIVTALRARSGAHPARSAPTSRPSQRSPGSGRVQRGGLGEVTGSWTYQDEAARPLFRVVRLERSGA